MDAVELNYLVDVAAPKLMGSDGFSRDRVTLMEVEAAACESSRELCTSLLSQKGAFFSLIFILILKHIGEFLFALLVYVQICLAFKLIALDYVWRELLLIPYYLNLC